MKTCKETNNYNIGDIIYLSHNNKDKVEYLGYINNTHCFRPLMDITFYDAMADNECLELNVPNGTIGFYGKPYGFKL